ncbi:hypothetical protein BDW59DRAFT_170522 [Aspergillus cavernicola]|uniref:F-box domain-containing protein n=1 Tax=Aspergillus cavernicola TaxID=176166 RepID=A0ABR4IP25_9EURO
MTPVLPPELLAEIAGYLQDAGTSLVPCTTVCRQWQAAFEPFIYSTLNVSSTSLEHFRAITSKSGQTRQAWIIQLIYHIVVPVDLPDWQTRKEKNYSHEPGMEPLTYDFDIASEYRWDFQKGRAKAVTVYRAQFNDDLFLLPDVPCIGRLSFSSHTEAARYHQIWAGAVFQIVQHYEYIRPDHLEYIQSRRQGKIQPSPSSPGWPHRETCVSLTLR